MMWLKACWEVVKRPWFGWVAFAILLFLYTGHPRTVTVTKTVTKTETKVVTQWKTRVQASVGTETKLSPDGTLTFTGPVTVSNEGVSASDTRTATATTTTVKSASADWSVGAGVLIPRPYLTPVLAYEVTGGRRIIGPFWLEAHVVVRPGWPDVGAGVRFEW